MNFIKTTFYMVIVAFSMLGNRVLYTINWRTFISNTKTNSFVKNIQRHPVKSSIAGVSTGLVVSGLAMNSLGRDNTKPKIIEGASYYKVHHPKCTELHKCMGYTVTKEDETHELESIIQKLNDGKIVASYHDRSGEVISIETIDPEAAKNSIHLYGRLNSKLDPNAKPQAFRAKIGPCLKRGRAITFYDENDEHLLTLTYRGGTELTKESREDFESYVDLSKLKTIEEYKPKKLFGIFG